MRYLYSKSKKVIAYLLPRVRGFIHRLIYSSIYQKIDGGFKKWDGAKIYQKDRISFGRNVTIPYGCFISPLKLTVGNNSWLGINAFICGEVFIGEDVAIGPNVVIPGANHDYKESLKPTNKCGLIISGTRINDGVWIGGNAVILDGVTIGKGAIIGAGAIVTKSIPEYSIAVGNPAKVIGYRGKNE